MTEPAVLKLSEYKTERFPPEVIPEEVARIIWKEYSGKVEIEAPSFRNNYQWELTSQGWVGYIPLSDEFGLSLEPKVELGNLFRMLEYAYNLESFKFLPGLFNAQSLEEFYERLASVLTQRVLDRSRKGLYREYVNYEEHLPYVSGRLDLQPIVREPWKIKPRCHYQEHTADIEENQILVWTLSVIGRSGLCTERVLPQVRRAYHMLQSTVSLLPFMAQDCVSRLYNRLNDDYYPLHSLCRFFLEHSGPVHKLGNHTMLPFLVDMALLYERFVAEWLRVHLPASMRLKAQEHVDIDQEGRIQFKVDLVLYDTETDRPLCVLDTKYKNPNSPATGDIAQVLAYAEAIGCRYSFLIYPTYFTNPLNATIGSIRISTLTFSLDGDVDQKGQLFIQSLLSILL